MYDCGKALAASIWQCHLVHVRSWGISICKARLALLVPSESSLRAICSTLDRAYGDSMLPHELDLSLASSVSSDLLSCSELGCCSSQAAHARIIRAFLLY